MLMRDVVGYPTDYRLSAHFWVAGDAHAGVWVFDCARGPGLVQDEWREIESVD